MQWSVALYCVLNLCRGAIMRKTLAGVYVLLSVVTAEAATNCHVPRIRTLDNQTVTGYMTIKSGKTCSIRLHNSRGPIFSAHIVARSGHGSVQVDGSNRIVYRPQSGFVGKDSFTYARKGMDTRNNPVTRTVQVEVDVTQ